MASFLSNVKTHFSSSLSPQYSKISATNHNLQIPGRVYGRNGERCMLSKLKCGKGRGSVWEIERKLEEMVIEKDKCKEVDGMVELLECLEREAIMGDDEGKEPMDYNRRAQIFDKSSEVFQALKERSEITTNSNI
ncbi:hypothetical protein RND71_018781 [Anisodus tanguticus]|uniref:Uncharacterized protein n=1 Tax=Anisodus tanguticus TaxID=243964 RepID=A0AAE1S4V6_9SOLA|nr:hypothetical protein RND71_018781 [Anisodus tanguticus]